MVFWSVNGKSQVLLICIFLLNKPQDLLLILMLFLTMITVDFLAMDIINLDKGLLGTYSSKSAMPLQCTTTPKTASMVSMKFFLLDILHIKQI